MGGITKICHALFEKSVCLDDLTNFASGKVNFRGHHWFVARKFNQAGTKFGDQAIK